MAAVLLCLALTVGTSRVATAEEDYVDLPIDESAIAGILEVPMVGSQAIANDSDLIRHLLQPGDLSQIDGEFVISATLRIPLTGVPLSKDLSLRIYAIDKEWAVGAATWSSPWSVPGGDVLRAYPANVEIPMGAPDAFIELDVSEAVRAMADREVGMNGFLMTIPEYLGDGLTSQDAASLALLSESKLYVDYRRISALGFPREGSKALQRRAESVREP
jgi:hypothetical protein